jgi:hypothetical protein
MHSRLVVALSSTLLFVARTANAESHTIWEIGKLDDSRSEFHAAPAQHIFYRVGESDWSRDWPGEQRLGW